MRRLRLGRALAALFAALTALSSAAARAQESGASTQPPVQPLSEQAEGAIVDSVAIRIRGSNTSAESALARANPIAMAAAGEPFSALLASRLIARLESEGALANVTYRLLPLANSPRIRIVFEADLASEAQAPGEGVPAGVFGEFPVFYKDDRSLLTAIVGGGLGVYSDGNPWFGQPLLFNRFNPLAGELPGEQTTWTEGSLELGIGGATQLGDTDYYAFAALTGMATWSVGQDIYTDETREFDAVEKAYAGVLYANRETREKARLSIGRQTYTLNDGFLVNLVKGSTNAGERGATYLGPRLTNDFSVLASASSGQVGFNFFYIDPNELESLESETTFLGANLRYEPADDLSVDASWITIPQSQSTYANPQGLTLDRQGLETVAGHLKWHNLGFDGLFAEAELAHQWHDDYAMSASAWYATIGYIARDLPWTPSISYRYSYFSGDDPETVQFERYDPLLNTGLGIWLQGLSFGKITSNSNLSTHRIQFNIAPVEALNITFDWHRLRAPGLNNLGSNPALSQLVSHELGQEFTLSARWAVSKNLYIQSIASLAMPGDALTGIGADENWSTLQLSVYWGL
jgi:hypothetical protein